MQLIEQDVQANGVRLHVYRTGSGRPPLVFAHGMMDNGLCFWPIAEQLADDFEIVLYDARGHGKSDPSSRETSLLTRARDLGGLVDALGLEKPGLIGHSLGATTAALCAGLFPDAPGCIVLEDPPPFETLARAGDEDGARWARWREWAEADKQRSVEELVEISRQRDPRWAEAERLPWAQAKQQFSLTVFDEEPLDDAAPLKRIAWQIACPTLLITADQKLGALVSLDVAEEMVAALPLAWHVNIPGAGHNIRRDQPGPYLQAIRDFLKEHS
jgi:N-formylmaleamate deformylase